MTDNKYVYNHKTKEHGLVPLTPEEIAERDARTAELEAERAEYEATVKYKDDRYTAYVQAGATERDVLEALWEKIVENDSTKADAMQIKREEIKALFPAPEAE